ncbi:MAG: YncE family protein [Proteobacteria bacterium]|nr:YncE family protein [Pseudomonadota bacterium]
MTLAAWTTRTRISSFIVAAAVLIAATRGGSAEPVAYAVMSDSNSVAIIDMAARAVVGSIPVPGNPHGGVLTPDGRRLYTASMDANKVYVIDTGLGRVIESIDVGDISHHAVVSPDGRHVYVAAADIVVIDAATNRIVARIPTEEPPFYLAFAPGSGLLFSLNMGTTVSVVDPDARRTVATVPMGAESVMGHLAFTPGGETLYATNDANDTVTVIDPVQRRVTGRIGVGEGPHGVATSGDGKLVYVANKGDRTYSVIEVASGRVVAAYDTGAPPEHISLLPDASALYVGIESGDVLVVDPVTSQATARISTWPSPHAFLFAAR